MSHLDDIRARIDRAENQLQAIEDAITTFLLHEDPYTVWREFDAKAFEYRIRVRINKPVPHDLRIAVSEIVQNLRTVLDNVIYACAVTHSGSDPPPDEDGIAFPIFKDRGKYPNGSRRALANVPDAARALAESLQTYRYDRPGDDPLWVLHRLANDDKHKRLHLIGASSTGCQWDVHSFAGGAMGHRTHYGPFEDGAVIASWYVGPGPHVMNVEFRFFPTLSFRGGGPASEKPVEDMLKMAFYWVKNGVVPQFEPFMG